jgi:D-alanyl-D-alanine carboxypeptidase (penicillin-binding protein 5/6)
MPLHRLLAALALAVTLALPARAFDTLAQAAFVYDVNTGTVLMNKNADMALPPASMSKLMTLNMLFEALRDGRVGLDTRFTVSSRAQQKGGSTMFLNTSDRPTVEELIKGIIVLSGNDACVVVAEGLAGTEEAFAEQMNERGRAIGLTQSNFVNSSGWPHPRHRMSMRDLGVLAVRLIEEFPEYYGYFAMDEFAWDGRAPQNRFNRNPLLGLGIGADGLKTGHTQEAGYGLVGSAKQGERRIVFVITGLDTDTARAEESERIVNWAFRQFVERTVVKQGTKLADIPVWLGEAPSVGAVVAADVSKLIPALVQSEIPGEISYDSPLEAPVTAGQRVGELIVRVPGVPEERVPLLADADVAEAGFMPRMRLAAELLLGRLREAL